MASDNGAVSCSAVLQLFIACVATISTALMASAAAGSAQITVLYDVFGKASTMQKDWFASPARFPYRVTLPAATTALYLPSLVEERFATPSPFL
jgi:hypothetical protein